MIRVFKVHIVTHREIYPTCGVLNRARICKQFWRSGIDSQKLISPAYVAWRARARIFKLLWSPGIDTKVHMNSASLCSLAGRYDNPIPFRFLAPIDSLKIPEPLYL